MTRRLQDGSRAINGGRSIKRLAVGVCFVTLGLGFMTAPAQAGERQGCVSRGEYNDVQIGWRQSRVADHFGTDGIRMTRWNSGGDIDTVWKYRKCSAWGPGGDYMGIWFDNYTHDTDGNHFQRVHKKVPNKPGRLAAHVDDLFG